MKLVALIVSALSLSTAAQAALPKIAPAPNGAPTCFKREYTAEHLAKNPGQLLETIYVKISHKSEKDEFNSWSWMPAEVVGVNHGDYYGNTAGCFITPKGNVECSIDCDGGSFSLNHSPKNPGSVNFVVTKDYYFPLFKGRMSYDEREEGSLNLGDTANRVYRLVPADVRECNQAIERTLGQGEGGC